MTTFLNLPGEVGDFASTPDAAPLRIVGDIDLRARVAPDDWTPAAMMALVTREKSSTGQASYNLLLTTTGLLKLVWSPDGTGGSSIGCTSSAATGFTDGTIHWVRVTLDVDNGSSNFDCKFWTSSDGSSWSQLGTTQNGSATTSIHAGTEPLTVGIQVANDPFAGNVYRAMVLDGIDGTVVFDADFTAETPGTTSFTEDSSNAATVTVNQSGDPKAEIVAAADIDGADFGMSLIGMGGFPVLPIETPAASGITEQEALLLLMLPAVDMAGAPASTTVSVPRRLLFERL